ncbi:MULTISPECIES: aminoacyl-tRNA deacylase [Anaerolinea]|uniref:aminoacyl-tRNA deacylase n=1 Tax=Anaerolinea TaxID=233189 RepID=UPI0026165049|nr:YbaK/EbsC family protein [Anaerolinea thermophila]
MQLTSAAIEYLRQKNIPFSTIIHPTNLTTLDEIARFRGQTISQIIRSLVFRYSDKDYVLVLAQAGNNVDWKTLRDTLGVRRITTATPDEVFRITGYITGSVSPFGLLQKIPVFVSRKILQEEIVSTGSGIPQVALVLLVKHFFQALEDYQLADF